MRSTMAVMLALLLACAPAAIAAPTNKPSQKKVEFASSEHILRWINNYRLRPEPGKLPAAVKAMSDLGVFREMDTAGIYVGFMAGVLNANPKRAEELVSKMYPMPPEDQVAIVRAIAYSDLPDWKDLMLKFIERMPARKTLIDRFVFGKQPTLRQMELDAGTTPLDTLWGFYFATGSTDPILRIISVLPWAKDQNNVERLTIGSMAKLSLATNASRDKELLDTLKSSMNQRFQGHARGPPGGDRRRRDLRVRPRAQGRHGGHRPAEDEGPSLGPQHAMVGHGGPDRAGARLRRRKRHGPGSDRHTLRGGRGPLRRRPQMDGATVAVPQLPPFGQAKRRPNTACLCGLCWVAADA